MFNWLTQFLENVAINHHGPGGKSTPTEPTAFLMITNDPLPPPTSLYHSFRTHCPGWQCLDSRVDPSWHQSATATLYEGAWDQLVTVVLPLIGWWPPSDWAKDTCPGSGRHIGQALKHKGKKKDVGGSPEHSGLALCPLGCIPDWAVIDC